MKKSNSASIAFFCGIAVMMILFSVYSAFQFDGQAQVADMREKAIEVCECHGGLKSITPNHFGEPTVMCKDGQVYTSISYAVFTCSEGK
jgi:hypothetical protein